ncbi:SOS response-associated peptidase family protein [Luteimonas sp. MC1895]|uniref:SOS response-associated peptidase family protein n=1 Tax=Luteimonas sp. MC1895 TaxID=2819513 RepID=UPI0018F0DDCC|nr:SOS response-associated peptidase family protein [Luteimonas sp. MC1895]MBJ6978091.1 SOS response-associated peptidase family protein [Luteimonas sp. MC1895]
MCYSALVYAEIRKLERTLGVRIDPDWYVEEFWTRKGKDAGKRPRMPRAVEREAVALAPASIGAAIAAADQTEIDQLTQLVFAQRKRVADAERSLQARETKKAREDIRIGTGKVEAAMRRLDELRTPPADAGLGRIYPGYWCPVVIRERGRYVARLMRYQCRLPDWTEAIERRYPGTYNARRDNLEKSWGKVFGHGHGVMVASAFYEHVDRGGQDQVLEFRPSDGRDMIAACLWTRTTEQDGSELYSFAAITDEPPAEVAAAGHDRCIVPIKAEHLEAWLTPDAANLAAMHAILDDRERPYYEHRQAA